MDDTAGVCAIASIQKSYVSSSRGGEWPRPLGVWLSQGRLSGIDTIFKTLQCPVVELLDNPDHRGTYQTMRSQAGINIQARTF